MKTDVAITLIPSAADWRPAHRIAHPLAIAGVARAE